MSLFVARDVRSVFVLDRDEWHVVSIHRACLCGKPTVHIDEDMHEKM